MVDLRSWARSIKRDVLALYLAGRDSRVPWYAKALALATAAYALSPIDLIPDFIPLLGMLDDVILIPLAILLCVRLIPPDLMSELRREAEQRLAQRSLTSRIAGAAIILVWLVSAGALGYALLR